MKNIIGRYLRWSLLTNIRTIALVGVVGEAMALVGEVGAKAFSDTIDAMRGEEELEAMVREADAILTAANESVDAIYAFRATLGLEDKAGMPEQLAALTREGYKGNIAPLIAAVRANNNRF